MCRFFSTPPSARSISITFLSCAGFQILCRLGGSWRPMHGGTPIVALRYWRRFQPAFSAQIDVMGVLPVRDTSPNCIHAVAQLLLGWESGVMKRIWAPVSDFSFFSYGLCLSGTVLGWLTSCGMFLEMDGGVCTSRTRLAAYSRPGSWC